MCIRPTKVVHPTYKSCASDLQTLCIRPTKLCIQPKKNCTSDLLLLYIQPTMKVVHPTYKRSASNQQLSVQPTYSLSDTLTFFNWVCADMQVIGPTVARSCWKTTCGYGPKYRRTDVTLGGCNTILHCPKIEFSIAKFENRYGCIKCINVCTRMCTIHTAPSGQNFCVWNTSINQAYPYRPND